MSENSLYTVRVVCNSTSQGVYEAVKRIQFNFLPSTSQLEFESIIFSSPVDGTFIKSDEHFDIT